MPRSIIFFSSFPNNSSHVADIKCTSFPFTFSGFIPKFFSQNSFFTTEFLFNGNISHNKIYKKRIPPSEIPIKDNKIKELNIIIKSDVQGSSEAIKTAILNIKNEEVLPKIIHSDIGLITETDVSLARASNAVLIAFNVKPSKEAKKMAEHNKIEIKYFNIIYEVLDFIKSNLSSMLKPSIEEQIIGSAEVMEIFKVSKFGKVAGSKVMEGEINQDSNARLIRDGNIVYTGKISSIYREKNAAKQVIAGLECGIILKDFADYKEKDIIEVYTVTTTERKI